MSEIDANNSEQKEQAQAAPQPRGRFSRIADWLIWAAVAAALVLAFMPRSSGPQEGLPAPAQVLPRVGAEGNFQLPGELQRPLLIEAFASWCSACRRTSGTLHDLRAAEKAGRLDVVAVSVDDRAEQALAAKKSWPIEVDVVHDESGSFSREYRVEVLPTYILIGTSGKVERVTAGVPGASDLRAWLKAADE